MSSAALKSQAKLLKAWTVDAALPFWAERAVDRRGGFYEELRLNGTANRQAVRRVRVQSRQIYVYALATKLGWYDGTGVADRAYGFLERYGYQKDGENDVRAGYAHRIGADYSVVDAGRDFYDHAFHLLGAASLSALPEAKHAAAAKVRTVDILGFVDYALEADNGGWLEGLPASQTANLATSGQTTQLPRRQNPHMHYLESSMALYDVSGDPKHLMPARLVYRLFKQHFFDPKNQVISEFFNADWSLESGSLGQSVEPGHAAEWVWLLWQFEKRTGIDTRRYCDALYGYAFVGNPVFLNDEEDKSGTVRRATKRLWVQTEVVRAHLAQMERGDIKAGKQAVRAVEALREHYLNDDGSWVDQLDENGMACAKTIPVSTFYHIISMVSEVTRLAG